ncbi:transcription elongation factor spt5 [Kappamyces sp. JEL0680]|nr:transcription elongation factor spt5 [Kappamyces sp. JEL0680]
MDKELFSEDESSQGEDLGVTEQDDLADLEREDDAGEEDDDDDEEEDDGRPKKKQKRKMNARSIFIEDQARVDDEDEDDDDDDAEDGFEYADDGVDAEQTFRDQARYRKLDKQRDQQQDEDAEVIAARLKERYGRTAGFGEFRGDSSTTPQAVLIPSVNDPKLWMVKCKPGAEKTIVFNLCRKFLNLENSKKPLEIMSCFYRDSLKGYIYIEADRQAHVVYGKRQLLME